ncbi:uncharacterized protein LOC133530935 [Cydia pomonella]|uniref:uncharacterized protein LOC133530935 n=1 Tax=Cydia pomonella TaxID=82600 RepID=UPI002ADD3DA5|nr:uncharacterized protein LOC133530935 [Cydia pomonella]
MKEMLKSIQKHQFKQSEEMKSLGDTIALQVIDKLDARLVLIEQKQTNLENKLELQENQIEQIERRLRQRNIVLFGLEEQERSYFDLETNVLRTINNTMQVQCYETDIESVRRLGKKGGNVRPVIITFATLGRKIQVLRKKKSLEGTNYYIKEDFTGKVLEKRKELQEEAKKERDKGNKVIIRQDKLIILKNKDISSQNCEQNVNFSQKKRNINSIYSPPQQTSDKENIPATRINPQATKKNKYIITDYMTTPTGTSANVPNTTIVQRPQTPANQNQHNNSEPKNA